MFATPSLKPHLFVWSERGTIGKPHLFVWGERGTIGKPIECTTAFWYTFSSNLKPEFRAWRQNKPPSKSGKKV
eukprot:353627-Chlamydomonas_euryale.AAC.1